MSAFQKDFDWEKHNLQITEENDTLRVLAGGHSYLMKNIGRDKLLKLYREAWNKVRLNFDPIIIDGETVSFNSSEQLYLQQRIVLDWLYVYIVNNQWLKFLFWRMKDSQVRRYVLEAAQVKCKDTSEKAIALAAHTLNMSRDDFAAWVKSDEEFQKMW